MQNSPVKDLARQFRHISRRSRQKIRFKRFSFTGIPVIFANSFPKSGTHLLTQVLDGFTLAGPSVNSGLPAVVTFNGFTGIKRTSAEILNDLEKFAPGDSGYGHLHAEPELVDILAGERFATIFLVRDLRDVVVSHAHYLTGMASSHIHHQHFENDLLSFDERLKTSILGRTTVSESNKNHRIEFPDIKLRFIPYLDWLHLPDVLVLRFEEMIQNIRQSTEKILVHAESRGFPLSCDLSTAIDRIVQNLNPERSPTFRKGSIGEWEKSFSEENKVLFKEVAGELLIKLGYETNFDW